MLLNFAFGDSIKGAYELLFADDKTLLPDTESDLQQLVDCSCYDCGKFGLMISIKKTKLLTQGADSTPAISINNSYVEVVESFTYLGSTITGSLSLNGKIGVRFGKAACVMGRLNK